MLNPTICPQCFQSNEPARTLCWKCMRSMTLPASEKDYIRIFELRGSWDKNDLRTAFRRLARKYHPDVNPGDREADSYFKFVNQAYEVLCRTADDKAAAKERGDVEPRPDYSKEPNPEMVSDELRDKLRALIRSRVPTPDPNAGKEPGMFKKFTRWLGRR